jgi:integrase
MPWKLVTPRPGKTKFYYVRGKYLGIALNKSTGTAEERGAKRILATWREQAERGEFSLKPKAELAAPATFLSAAVAYMQAGYPRQYIQPILDKWGEKPLTEIDQIALDTAAAELYPRATPQTRNRQFYTPVSAILKHAGIERRFKRPKGWKGKKSTSWLEPAQAFALFAAADRIEPEFGLLCRFLLYTGMRIDEALSRPLRDLRLDRAYVYLPDSKNGEPRGCHLPPILIEAFKAQPPRSDAPVPRSARGRFKGAGRKAPDAGVPFLERHPEAKLFRFYYGSALRKKLSRAIRAAGIPAFPRRQGGFHIFCHTYGSWMHRFGELDTHGLTRTGRWADPDSADRYVHTQASEEARRADLLPTPGRGELVDMKLAANEGVERK